MPLRSGLHLETSLRSLQCISQHVLPLSSWSNFAMSTGVCYLVDLRGSRPLRFAVYVRLPVSVLLPYRTIMKMVSRARKTAKVADAGRKTLLLALAGHEIPIASRGAISPGNKKAQAAYACGTWGDAACAIVISTWTSSPGLRHRHTGLKAQRIPFSWDQFGPSM